MNRSDNVSSARSEAGPELDFEHADFGDASEQPRSGSLSCSICENAIQDAYFTRDQAFVCARCEGPARTAGPPGSRPGRLLGAGIAGGFAAIIASALWMAVTELTGYEIGLIAIAVGWIVGVAIQIGNRGVGGVPYQLLAVFLTYSAIVMTYVPMLVTEFEAQWTGSATEEIQVEGLDLGRGLGLGQAEPSAMPAASDTDVDPAIAPDESELSPQEAKRFAWIVSIPLAYAVPFLAGFENAIGILIIGFALYQAWRMTAKVATVWAGPFQVGREPAA